MDAFRKILIGVFGILAGFGISVWVMTLGWGLHAQSWSVIIWGTVISCVLAGAISVAGSK